MSDIIWRPNPKQSEKLQYDTKGTLGNFAVQISHQRKFGPLGFVKDQSVEWALIHTNPGLQGDQHPVVWARGVAGNPEQAKTEAVRAALIHMQRVAKKEKTARPLIQVARKFLEGRPKP